MTQQLLDFAAPSREARAKHRSSGRENTNKLKVLELVRLHPGSTSGELSQAGSLDLTETRRRLTDLYKAKLIAKSDIRPCRVLGSKQTTYIVNNA